MKCPTCEFENLDHAVRCMGCGETLAASLPPVPPPVPPLQPQELQELGSPTTELPPLNLGDLVGMTFSIYFQNFGIFFLITAIANIPSVALMFFTAGMAPEEQLQELVAPMLIAAMLIQILASALATSALTYGVLQHLREKRIVLGDCLRVGLVLLVRVFLVGLLEALIVGLGAIACCIPGLIALVMLSVAVPAVVEERVGVFKALQRSIDLTEGYRWHIFGLIMLIVVIHLGASFVTGAVSVADKTVGLILQLIENILYSGILATACGLVYYRLRCLKESVDIDGLASVFD